MFIILLADRYLWISCDVLIVFSDCDIRFQGDDLLRVPIHNPEAETRDFLRLISCQSDETSNRRIVTADEYLMPQSTVQASVVQVGIVRMLC